MIRLVTSSLLNISWVSGCGYINSQAVGLVVNDFDTSGRFNLVGAVGIEPTFAALSRRCLRGYKSRP